MNAFDWIILIILAVFVFNGFRRGFLREIAGLAGIIVAFILAVHLMKDVAVIVSYYLGLSQQVAVIVTAVVLFLLVLSAFIIAAKMLRKILDMATLGWIDRLTGSLFGLLKGAVIISILALIISLVPVGGEFSHQQDESVLFHPMRKVAPMVFNGIMKIVPAANDFYSELKQSLSDRSGIISIDSMKWLSTLQKKKVDQPVAEE